MKAEKVALRKLHEGDINIMAQLANNKKIWNNVRDYFPYPYTQKDAYNFIYAASKEDPQTTFGITYMGEFVGVIGLVGKADVHRKTAEIGYWLGEPFWNKGIASKAVKLIVDYGFYNLGLERIETGVFEFNIASGRVLEKCGFEKDGFFRNSIIKNGQFINEVRYGLVKRKD